jgi:putative ABC transport system permease protein
MSASISILTSLDKPFKEFAKECNSATAIMYPYSKMDKEVVALGEQFTKLSKIERVEYSRVHYITEELTFNEKKIEGFLKLTEYKESIFRDIHFLKGDKSTVSELKDDECIIPACVSNQDNIRVGDKIKIKLPSGDVFYKVKGIYSEVYEMLTSYDCDILIKKLPEGMNSYLNIKLYGKSRVTGAEIEEQYRKEHDGQMNGMMVTLEATINNNQIAGNVIGAVFLAIGVIMLVVSCIIINFMIQNLMITDAKIIAIYKTIGYNSGDILSIYLKFYFLITSLACILGGIASSSISNIILSSMFKNMGKVITNNVFVPSAICYVVIVILVNGIIYRIINKTKKVKPVYALNGMTNSSTKKKKAYKGNFKFQFSAIGIALRGVIRNRKNAIVILITSIVTIFSINFGVISLDVANTMKDNNDYWLGVDKSDVMINVTDSNNNGKVEDIIKADSRVNYYLNSNIATEVTMKWKKGMKSTAMKAFVYDDYLKTKLPIIEGRNPETSKEIAIGSKVAKDLNKAVGDYIEIYLGGEKRVNLLISGIFQTYYDMGDCCRLTTAVYTNNNYDFHYNYFSIYLKDKKQTNSFIEDLKKKVGGNGNVTARTEAFSSIMDMIVTPQKGAIPPVVALVLLVGGINIFCIVILRNTSNEKTNGIYKCLGYSTWHLICSNLYYVGMLAVISIIIAVPMIIIFYPSIMKVCLSMFGFVKYPVTYNYFHIALANIAVLIAFVISTLISSRSLKKVNVRDLVQE